MLYSPTLLAIIEKTPTIKNFRGVFAADEVPLLNSDCSLIVNTDPSFLPGEHWIAIHVDKGQTKVFDSFGFPPPLFITEKSAFNVSFNPNLIQHPLSDSCGLFCIVFLTASNGGHLNNFFDTFSGDPRDNKTKLLDLFDP